MCTFRIALFLCLTLHCSLEVGMDALVQAGIISPTESKSAGSVSSFDLSQSSMWAVQSIQAPELFHQFGISQVPSQWYLLNDTTVQEMFKNVEQKVGNSLLSDRVQLSCLVAHDMKKLPSNEEKKQKNIFNSFLKICLPSLMLRDLKLDHIEKIEATGRLMLMEYVANSLVAENAGNVLPLEIRKFIPRLDLLIKHDGVQPGQNIKVLNALRKNKVTSTASKPYPDIMTLANHMLGESLAVAAAARATDQSPLTTFNPSDSVLITEEVQGATNIFDYLKERAQCLNQEIASLNAELSATETVLGTPEISNTILVRRVLEELLQQRIRERFGLLDQLEAYLRAQSEVHQQVDTVHETLTTRLRERDDALSKVDEQIKIIRSKLTTVEQFLARAQVMKAERQLELENLCKQRDAIESAQQRVQPGLQVVAEFRSKNQP